MDADLYRLLGEACGACGADAVALSGGLDSTIVAHMMGGRRPRGIAVAARDFEAADLPYSRLAASSLGMDLHTVRPDTDELLGGVAECIRILGNFNDMEIRNGAVMYAAIRAAGDLGVRSLATGDGADELFAGYRFLYGMDPARLARELRRIRDTMHFASRDIGRDLGVGIESPFLHPGLVDAAAAIPAEMHAGERGGTRMGKMVLRRMFEGKIPDQIVWRAKSPMQDGAGTSGLAALLDSRMTDGAFRDRAGSVLKRDGVRIRTKESLHYYEEYRRRFGPPEPASGGRRGCSHCGFALGVGSKFCRMCGAFPA